MEQLPKRYEERMRALLGEEYPAYLDSLTRPVGKGLRVNENKITVEEFLYLWEKTGEAGLTKIPWIHNGFFIPKGVDAADLSLYQAGLYYIQEPAAMSPAEYLPVAEGDRVLDLCAAPGGKATELLSKLHGSGVLLANDSSASRAKALKKNLELAGAVNAFVTAEMPERLAGFYPSYFQKILVDAPCSGEGMFRVQPAMIRHWEECGPESYVPVQRSVLESAWRMLAPGGMLMYSTCTFSREEDEDQVLDFLARHSDMEAVPLPHIDGFARLIGRDGTHLPFVRLYPHKISGEGQFMALLRKRKSGSAFGGDPESEPLLWKRGTEVYRLPAGMIPEKSLHYLMTGLHLGTVKNGFLIPSQAEAMAEDGKKNTDRLDLCYDDPRVRKYLKGETVMLKDEEMLSGTKTKRQNRKRPGPDVRPGKGQRTAIGVGRKKEEKIGQKEIPEKDLTLVLVEGWPLGYGKRSGARLKNLRNAGWRIQT